MLRGGSWVTDPLVARPDLPQLGSSAAAADLLRPSVRARCLARDASRSPRRRSPRRGRRSPGLDEATLRACTREVEGAADGLALRRARLAAVRGDHAAAGVLPPAARGARSCARGRRRSRQRTRARTLVELGAGSATNTRFLLDALDGGTLERFVPLDVSEQTLRTSAQAIAAAYPQISVHAIVGDFERDLGALPDGERRLIAFLGSTIGNLYPRAARSVP